MPIYFFSITDSTNYKTICYLCFVRPINSVKHYTLVRYTNKDDERQMVFYNSVYHMLQFLLPFFDISNKHFNTAINQTQPHWVKYLKKKCNLGPNHLLFLWQISVQTKTEFHHLVGALMEHFLEGSVRLLRLW